MNLLQVVQHTSADYLGLMEDHLEGRRIRFQYHRPFTESGGLPGPADPCDGLFLLGGGPWGSAGGRDVPTLNDEIRLARDCLDRGIPVVGIGLGSQVLALAAGGGSEESPLNFEADYAHRCEDDALEGFLPERFPWVTYMKDRPVPPSDASVLAQDPHGRAAVFSIGSNALGFTGHPGFKTAMAEDLVMEFEEAPDDPAPVLQTLQRMSREIEDALVHIMTGLVRVTGWMRPKHHIPLRLQ